MLASPGIASIAHRLFDCGIPIFMLHRIAKQGQPCEGKTDPDHLRKCLDYLRNNNYTTISLEQLITALHENKPLPPNPVCFTMDDGYIDQAQIAAPIFIEYDCPITFFVITGMLDQKNWPWDAQIPWIIDSSKNTSLESSAVIQKLGIDCNDVTNKRDFRRAIQNAIKIIDAEIIPEVLQQIADAAGVIIPDSPPPDYQPMNWDSARQLEKQGIRFAPHSVTHNILSRLSQKSMEQEITQAWQIISNELENPLKVFCYPTGRPIDYGDREIDALKKAGYLGAMSTTPDFVMNDKNTRDQVYSLPRLALPDNMTDFIQGCSWMECLRGSRYKIRH